MKKLVAPLIAASCMLVACDRTTVCDEWKPFNFPKVTQVNSCKADGIHYNTTATEAETMSAFAAQGYVAGRVEGSSTIYLRKQGSTTQLSTLQLTDPISISKEEIPPDSKPWKSLDELAKMLPLPQLRAEAMDRLKKVKAAFDAAKDVPAKCIAPVPAAAMTPPIDFIDLSADQFGIVKLVYDDGKAASLSGDDERALRVRLDRILAADDLFVLSVTKFAAAKIDATTKTFSSGHIAADVAVMSAKQPSVLCKRRVSADSSSEVDVFKSPNGEVQFDTAEHDLWVNLQGQARKAIEEMVPKGQ